MPITSQQKKKIIQVINVFETGSINGNYASISIYADGPLGADKKPIKQITYGRSQTTEFGVLKVLLQQYIANSGIFASSFKSYISNIGKQPSLNTDAVFKKLLKDAALQDPIMATTQDHFFDQLYYEPALSWFENMGFTLPLSLLVIYDSFIHSGSIPGFLREKFAEKIPKNGGDEKKWIKQYTDTRHNWLTNHTRLILRKTNYRTADLQKAITQNNWDLSEPFVANKINVL